MSKKLVAFNGSQRKGGNTSILLEHFLDRASQNEAETKVYDMHSLDLEFCRGCLRCNTLGYCSIRTDEWAQIAEFILAADVLVFASPIYFHHVSAAMKKLIDRFRSFVHVQITETGLIHTPHTIWEKEFVLLLSMGSSDKAEADPVIDLFRYITSILGTGNHLHVVAANRMAVVHQLIRSETELSRIYQMLKLPVRLAAEDFRTNRKLLKEVEDLGNSLFA